MTEFSDDYEGEPKGIMGYDELLKSYQIELLEAIADEVGAEYEKPPVRLF